VGYSALSQRNDRLAQELLEEHRALLRPLFMRFNGAEIKTIGDAFLVEFNSALEAAQCAIEIQRALAKRNHDVTAERRIDLKIGIHIGDVVHRGGDVYGDGVNIASRIEPLAGAGGICVSMDVERQIRNALEARFEKLGATDLKNIKLPMELFRIVLPWEREHGSAAARSSVPDEPPRSNPMRKLAVPALVGVIIVSATAWWLRQPHGASLLSPSPGKAVGRITSLAVKPLDDYSGDTNNAYLSDGMTEALCMSLGNLSAALRVPGRSSVMRYKGGQKSIQDIARELNVEAIVEGSVQRAASNMLVTVQLIEAATDRHLWATNYQRDLSDFFKVQNEVAQAIAAEIQVRLSAQDEARLSLAPSLNPLVVETYLQGRFHLARGTREGFEQSLIKFREALRLDPRFAKAYSGIADAYILAGGWWVDDALVLSEGLKAATNALALDATAAEPQASLGWLYTMSWRWAEADEAFKSALRLNPRYARTYEGFGWLKLFTGRSEQGLNLLVQSQEMEPGSPLFAVDVAWACIHLGQYDRATSYLDKALELDRNFWLAQGLRGLLFAFQGNYADAALWADKAVQSSGRNGEMLGNLGWIYGKAGDSTKARSILDELRTSSRPEASHPQMLAWVYLGLDEKEEAIKQLQEAVRKRDFGLMFLRFDRRFDPLRHDARFREIAKQVGLDK